MKNLTTTLFLFCALSAFSQEKSIPNKKSGALGKYRLSVPYLIPEEALTSSWNERTSIQMIEFHLKRKLDEKNIIGLKFATWRLFQPMGIQFSDGLIDKIDSGSEYYPGHVKERGIGITYQRMLWKGLFATIEILPQYQTYKDLEGNKIGNDFKLYNSYHLGYHISFGQQKRFFIEPQVHINQWMFDNNAPDGFKQLDDKWDNYFLFEPNIYLGVNF